MSMDSEKIEKKIPKIFRIFGLVTDFRIDFLSDAQLCTTFGDLTLIDQVFLFNLSHMTALRSIKLKSYYEITKK